MHEKESGEVDLLTKGDNNAVDDRGLYAGGLSPFRFSVNCLGLEIDEDASAYRIPCDSEVIQA